LVNKELETLRKDVWTNLRHYLSFCLGGLRKITKSSIRISSLWTQISNLDLPKVNLMCYTLTRTFGKLSLSFAIIYS
jgi:hypothetical protein